MIMWFLVLVIMFVVMDIGSEVTKIRKSNDAILKELKRSGKP